jgi:probable addiction module antidote protein
MTNKVKADELPTFNMADHLDSDEAISEYLSQVMSDGDDNELAHALGHVTAALTRKSNP